MKKIMFIFLCSLVIIGCMRPSNNIIKALKCSVAIDIIRADIRNAFDADSVIIYSKKVKEEVYFPEIHSPVILIYNATANALNFKSLPTSHYQRFDNFEEIENMLKREAVFAANSLIEKCDMSEFNDLIIEFLKLDDKGKPIYRFICHYNELLE